MIYLIEERNLKDDTARAQVKQSLIGTEVRDQFLIVEAQNLIDVIRVLSQWTHMIHQQIGFKLQEMDIGDNFMEREGCLLFDQFNSSMDAKKSVCSATVLFGRQLMAVDGVTDMLASMITSRFATMRHLYNAWDQCKTQEEGKYMLHYKVNETVLQSHKNVDTGEVLVDDDLLRVYAAMDSGNIMTQPISKTLSERIYNSLYLL